MQLSRQAPAGQELHTCFASVDPNAIGSARPSVPDIGDGSCTHQLTCHHNIGPLPYQPEGRPERSRDKIDDFAKNTPTTQSWLATSADGIGTVECACAPAPGRQGKGFRVSRQAHKGRENIGYSTDGRRIIVSQEQNLHASPLKGVSASISRV